MNNQALIVWAYVERNTSLYYQKSSFPRLSDPFFLNRDVRL